VVEVGGERNADPSDKTDVSVEVLAHVWGMVGRHGLCLAQREASGGELEHLDVGDRVRAEGGGYQNEVGKLGSDNKFRNHVGPATFTIGAGSGGQGESLDEAANAEKGDSLAGADRVRQDQES